MDFLGWRVGVEVLVYSLLAERRSLLRLYLGLPYLNFRQ